MTKRTSKKRTSRRTSRNPSGFLYEVVTVDGPAGFAKTERDAEKHAQSLAKAGADGACVWRAERHRQGTHGEWKRRRCFYHEDFQKRTSRNPVYLVQNGYGRSYSGDPRWMTAKYAGVDDEGNKVRKGDEVLYWPSTKRMMTGAKAKQAWQQFLSEKGDEEGTPYARNPRRRPSRRNASDLAEGTRVEIIGKRRGRGFGDHRGALGTVKSAYVRDEYLVVTDSGLRLIFKSSMLRPVSQKNPRLSKKRRSKLPGSKFVFPKDRAWPIESAQGARDAIKYIKMGRVRNAGDFMAIRSFILKRYPAVWRKYGLDASYAHAAAARKKGAAHRARTVRTSRKAAN